MPTKGCKAIEKIRDKDIMLCYELIKCLNIAKNEGNKGVNTSTVEIRTGHLPNTKRLYLPQRAV
jgi:hypothetical protein